MKKILLVDDDPGIRDSFQNVLTQAGYSVVSVSTGLDALDAHEKEKPDLILLDLKLPDIDGMKVLEKLKLKDPSLPILIISGYSTMNSVISAIKQGAYDFLPKPLDPEFIMMDIEKALKIKELENEVAELRKELEEPKGEYVLIGNNPKMQEIYKTIGKIAKEDISVLITGETGTGKELVARIIHQHSTRKDKPFVVVDSSATPSSLLESELFGHEKGAFTGAISRQTGRFEQANKGTIFLDEIANMDLNTQAKFLRVLQEREFYRIGAEQPIKVDVRVIAATNKDLTELVEKGLFREDLYHRLSVVHIKLPPLRERKDDIPLLVHHFINKFYNQHDGEKKQISKKALNKLLNYNWPGNVRELENIINQAIVISKAKIISVDDINLPEPHKAPPAEEYNDLFKAGFSLKEKLEGIEKEYILTALKHTDYNCSKAARLLGIDRKLVTYKMQKYKIPRKK